MTKKCYKGMAYVHPDAEDGWGVVDSWRYDGQTMTIISSDKSIAFPSLEQFEQSIITQPVWEFMKKRLK